MRKICIAAVILCMVWTLAGCSRSAQNGELQRSSAAVSAEAPEESEGQSAIQSETEEDNRPEAEAEEPEEQDEREPSETSEPAETTEGEAEEMRMEMKIGETAVAVAWEDNASVAALAELVGEQPLSIQMSMYGGFEQVGSLGTDLPRDDEQTTTQPGDIVLYSGDQIVVFYGSNAWAYTRLGRITDKSAEELKALLSHGDVTITLEPIS